MNVILTAEKYYEKMRAAYLDGLNDSRGRDSIAHRTPNNPLDSENEELWGDSVTIRNLSDCVEILYDRGMT